MIFQVYRAIMYEVIACDVQEIERTEAALVPQETRLFAVAQAETRERSIGLGATVTMATEKTLDLHSPSVVGSARPGSD